MFYKPTSSAIVFEVSTDTIFHAIGFFHLSNWQKVQLNTDLFSGMQKYLYTNPMAQLKENQMS